MNMNVVILRVDGVQDTIDVGEYVIEDCGAISVWHDSKRVYTVADGYWVRAGYVNKEPTP